MYPSTFVFPNDFAALIPEVPDVGIDGDPMLRAQVGDGECRVVCFSPRHDFTLAEMPVEAIESVVDLWAEQVNDLGERYEWVQVFENKGVMMGCSNSHPYAQVWAGSFLPDEPAIEGCATTSLVGPARRAFVMDLCAFRTVAGETCGDCKAALGAGGAMVGYVAVSDSALTLAPCPAPAGTGTCRTTTTGADPSGSTGSVRQPV